MNRTLCNKVFSGTVELCHCGQNRELGAVWLIGRWSLVDISPSCDGEFVSVLQVSSGVLVAAAVWILNCDNSTQSNVTALHSS